MTATINILGELTVGSLFPTFAGLLAGLSADASGRLQGLLAMSASIALQPPSIALMAEALVAVSAAINTGGISLSINVQAELIAELTAEIKLMAKLILALGGSAAAEVFTVSGKAVEFGGACGSVVGGGIQGGLASDHVEAIVFVTRYPAFIQDLLVLMGQV
jgi:hypothetical protein